MRIHQHGRIPKKEFQKRTSQQRENDSPKTLPSTDDDWLSAAEKRLDEEEEKIKQKKTAKARQSSHKITKKKDDEKLPRLSSGSGTMTLYDEAKEIQEQKSSRRHTSAKAMLEKLALKEKERSSEENPRDDTLEDSSGDDIQYESLPDEEITDVSERYERLEKMAKAATQRMRDSVHRAATSFNNSSSREEKEESTNDAAFLTAVATDLTAESKSPMTKPSLDRDKQVLLRDMSDLLERISSVRKELLEIKK